MSKKYLSLLPIFIITLLCAVSARADWQDPTGAPPGNNQPRPLNVGAVAQEKTGPLILSHASNALILRDQSPLLFGNPTGNTVGFRAPSGLGASTLWTLPIADGTNGTVLTTNGAGQLSWTTPITATVDLDWRYEGTSENFTSIYSEKLTRVGSGGTRNYATGDGDLYVQNKLEVDNGLYIGGLTTGSVVFQGGDGKLAQDNVNFTWDDSIKRLKIKTLELSKEAPAIFAGENKMLHIPVIKKGGSLTDTSNLFFGISAGNSIDTSIVNNPVHGNIGIGESALMLFQTGSANTTVGRYTLYLLQNGSGNSAFGYNALANLASGNNNTAIGAGALGSLLLGSLNTAIGYSSFDGAGSALNSTAVGSNAGQSRDGDNNVFLGTGAGRIKQGLLDKSNNNMFLGVDAGIARDGDNNVFLGASSGRGSQTLLSSSNNNVFIGVYSGRNKAGDNNVLLGYRAGDGLSNYSDNNIFLGFEAGLANSGSYLLFIEPSSADKDNALIYGQFYNPDNASASPLLRVNGKLGLAPKGTAGFDMPNSLLHLFAPGGSNAEIDIQSVVGPGQHWGIYQDRADTALKFWHLGVNRLVINDQGLSVTGNLTANNQRGFTGYTCLPNANGFGVRHRYESGLLICTCVDTVVCPGTCTCSNP